MWVAYAELWTLGLSHSQEGGRLQGLGERWHLRLLLNSRAGTCPPHLCSDLDSPLPVSRCLTSSRTPQQPGLTWPLSTPPSDGWTKVSRAAMLARSGQGLCLPGGVPPRLSQVLVAQVLSGPGLHPAVSAGMYVAASCHLSLNLGPPASSRMASSQGQ